MVKLDEKDLYQLLIAEFRYAVKRDNHLAPGSCIQHIMDYLPEMSSQWKTHTAEQLTNEIIQERLFIGGRVKGRLEQDAEWEKLLVFLTGYITKLPYAVEKYMQYIYNKPDWEANIDYYSPEMAAKIKLNQTKFSV
jgi:hypothetical protein